MMVSDPVVDSFYDKAIAAKNEDEVKKIFRDANEYVARKHFAICLVQPMQYSLYQSWLKGYHGQFRRDFLESAQPLLLYCTILD